MERDQPFRTVGPRDNRITVLPVKEEDKPAYEAARKEIERRTEELRQMYAKQSQELVNRESDAKKG